MVKKTQDKSTWERLSSKALYPPKMNWLLLLPLRNLIFSPKKLAKRLGLQDNWTVLDFGCGPGYFAPYIAKPLSNGKLYLIDVQEDMVIATKKRLAKLNFNNIEVQWTDGITLAYANNTFDCVYLIAVLGEIQNLEAMLSEIYRVMKPNGRLSITEMAGDPDVLSLSEVCQLVQPTGFIFEESYSKRLAYTVNFKKPI